MALQLLDPVHDETEAQPRGADGEELRLLVLIYRKKLYRRQRVAQVREREGDVRVPSRS